MLQLPLTLLMLLPGLVSPAPITTADCMYNWLRGIGLNPAPAQQYRQLFLSEEMTETVLSMTSLEQLKELGITKMGHRTLIHAKLQIESMCKNDGVCVLSGAESSSFACSCPQGYGGETCSLVTGCGETVCQNDAVCSLNNEEVLCSCTPGYSGLYCEIDVCEQAPCENGGVCLRSDSGYYCQCSVGFEGMHCDTMWLNHSSFIRLTKQVSFLEEVYKGALTQNEHGGSGPRFFVKDSLIGTQGVVQTHHFTASDSVSYIMTLSDVPSQPQLSGLYLYRSEDNDTLSLIHTLMLPAPSSLAPFTIGDSWYVAIVNVPSATSEGPNTHTTIYKWTGEQLILMQTIAAPGARSVHHLIVSEVYHFLIVSCGSDGEGLVHNSVVYVWFNGAFVFYQSLVSGGGEGVSSLHIPHEQILLAVASQSKSTLYYWNGTYFAPHQELPSTNTVELFSVGSMTFLLTVGVEENVLYHYRAGLFVPHAAAPPAHTAVHLHILSEHFIAFGRNATVDIQLLDGAGLSPFQTLSCHAPCHALSQVGGARLAVSVKSEYSQQNTVLYDWTHN